MSVTDIALCVMASAHVFYVAAAVIAHLQKRESDGVKAEKLREISERSRRWE